ncbi:hypothetical protein KFL_000050470 [Klebsormidium nitens]|uniref:F-box domain-containing protein n=1 Tax=Klebsormidium nitens TaxID=105231 RepID=A0A1Y1HLR0_KLENI|nr:hypothetical protein KFL_000050470 [Klebsormidium nitens]|eukprot:GAQ77911.1 hypothetical protein KFL_000050470 [Klebsormidium nitens]
MTLSVGAGATRAAENGSALHELPLDVLAIILSKLAVQDPPSFIDATYACRTFQNIASDEQLSLWKKMFHEREQFPAECSEAKAFEDAIKGFSGYRNLVIVRWEKQKKKELSSVKSKSAEGNACPQIRLLFLVKSLQKRIILWGVANQEAMEPGPVRQRTLGSNQETAFDFNSLESRLKLASRNAGMELGLANISTKAEKSSFGRVRKARRNGS